MSLQCTCYATFVGFAKLIATSVDLVPTFLALEKSETATVLLAFR
jgi:hypothetical protein